VKARLLGVAHFGRIAGFADGFDYRSLAFLIYYIGDGLWSRESVAGGESGRPVAPSISKKGCDFKLR